MSDRHAPRIEARVHVVERDALRISSPAPVISTRANAISVTTRAFRTRSRPADRPPVRPPSLSASCGGFTAVRSAGASPKTSPLNERQSSAKPSTGASTAPIEPRHVAGSKATSAGTPQ